MLHFFRAGPAVIMARIEGITCRARGTVQVEWGPATWWGVQAKAQTRPQLACRLDNKCQCAMHVTKSALAAIQHLQTFHPSHAAHLLVSNNNARRRTAHHVQCSRCLRSEGEHYAGTRAETHYPAQVPSSLKGVNCSGSLPWCLAA